MFRAGQLEIDTLKKKSSKRKSKLIVCQSFLYLNLAWYRFLLHLVFYQFIPKLASSNIEGCLQRKWHWDFRSKFLCWTIINSSRYLTLPQLYVLLNSQLLCKVTLVLAPCNSILESVYIISRSSSFWRRSIRQTLLFCGCYAKYLWSLTKIWFYLSSSFLVQLLS